jgi:hypothetical protein
MTDDRDAVGQRSLGRGCAKESRMIKNEEP